MEHLIPEVLARLVDELPTPAEREHLEACDACAAELEALRRQSEWLARLPVMRPAPPDFDAIEERLAAEGLIQVASRAGYPELAVTPRWMRRVAAVVLFAGGALSGAVYTSRVSTSDPVEVAGVEEPADPAAALAQVEQAERAYMAALVRYRQITTDPESDQVAGDPMARYVALESLVRAGQDAVRQAPADPFLNGLLASAIAEQQAVSRGITSGAAPQDGWF